MTRKQGLNPPAIDRRLEDFKRYVKDHDIFINPLISPYRFLGRGLGIRTNGSISPKTKLMHVPTSAILKWSDIPKDFMPSPPPPAGSGSPRVHSRLAAWLAFDKNGVAKYGPWMATWPKLEEFKAGVPLLWPEKCSETYISQNTNGHESQLMNDSKKRRISKLKHEKQGFAILPPGITGKWATIGDQSYGLKGGGILAPQQRKFQGDLAAATSFFPALKDRSSPELQSYTWTWCCVNTRCFYYWRTWGKKPPSPPDDRDEAMAMCPGMDFFNHTANEEGGLCCTVEYDATGFTVWSPDARVKEAEELFISYGSHGEEDLWVEYGFMLGDEKNRWDSINIDAVVFGDVRMGKDSRSRLNDAGYQGEYTLRRDSVCWRTETAARLLVMDAKQWDRFVEGRYGDEHDMEEEEIVKLAADEVVSEWVCKVRREAENSIHGLENLTHGEFLAFFSQIDDGIEEERLKNARARRDMCLSRWRQMLGISESAIEAMKE